MPEASVMSTAVASRCKKSPPPAARARSPRRRRRRTLAVRWLAGLGLAAAAAFCLLAVLFGRPTPPPPDFAAAGADDGDPTPPPGAPARDESGPAAVAPNAGDPSPALRPPAADGSGPRPAAAGPAGAPAAGGPRPPRPFKHINALTEQQLLIQLAGAPEVGLGADGPAALKAYVADAKLRASTSADFDLTDPSALLALRPDLFLLPIRGGAQCQLGGRSAAMLGALSPRLHDYLNAAAPPDACGERQPTQALRLALHKEMRGKYPEWLCAEAVPTLQQILMPEDAPLRRLLVDLLADIPDKPATRALAQHAVYDLDPDVREAAVAALKARPAEHYRPALLQALRYPWPPAADHAAEALAALDDQAAVPQLIALLNMPDPAAPQSVHKDALYIQEVVRAHHLTNCLLCHPPAVTGTEPVIGHDPVLTVPKATPTQKTSVTGGGGSSTGGGGGGGYGGGGGRSGGGSSPSVASSHGVSVIQIPLEVRADITYLRQDFSLRLPVPQLFPRPGPLGEPRQRFDYVVRTRRLTPVEWKLFKDRPPDPMNYPQREAVLFALRELTGQDPGPATEDWMRLYPGAEEDAEAARLSTMLLNAKPTRQEELILKERDAKGLTHTMGLALAVPRLPPAAREKARDALVQRFTRMTAATLRSKFEDADPEVRRAAVQAAAGREKDDLTPDLMALLDDPDPLTARAAVEALKARTGKDFDDPAGWKGWWKKRGDKPAGDPPPEAAADGK
jgi:HEAT repeat protein